MKFVRHGQSEFNVRFAATGRDPGIEDAPLTELGKRQADAAGRRLKGAGFARIMVSPYTRALQTAHIINDHLGLPIAVEQTIREWGAFSCDIGSPPEVLAASWPHLDFSALAPVWWPRDEESHEVDARAEQFWTDYGDHPERDGLLCVSHWGFIRALTGIGVGNCAIVQIDRRRQARLLHDPPVL